VNATFRGLRHWNFHLLSFWLALSLLCDVSYATMNKQEVLIRTPLLHYARHRAMITPVSPVRTRLIYISPNSRTIYRSFEIILEWGPSIRLEFKCCMQIHCFKKHSIWYELTLKKYLIAEGSSGSNGLARVKRKRTYSWEPLLCYEKYFLIYVTCKVNTEVQHETKICEHWQDPMERARVNNFNQWNGWCHKYAKQASSRSTL